MASLLRCGFNDRIYCFFWHIMLFVFKLFNYRYEYKGGIMKRHVGFKSVLTSLAAASLALLPMTAFAAPWGATTPLVADTRVIKSESPVTTTNTTSKTQTPVATIIQNNTELGTTRAVGPTGKQYRASIGLDNYFSANSQLYAVPMSYSFSPDFYINLTTPIVSMQDNDGTKNTGIGDISFTGKYRLGSEETLEIQSLLTIKFATGDAGKNLGTGSYDGSITEKLIKRFDKYRFTLMGGVTQAFNEPIIKGNKVTYGTQMSYMAAAEANMVMPELWFGIRASGINNLNNVVDGYMINDDITTVDITPEVKYFMSNGAALSLSVIIPTYTRYKISGAKDREVTANFGVFKAF
jgi:hypothetical protein